MSVENKINIQEHNQNISALKNPISVASVPRLDSDESCDFFSDNLSETAAGAIPENKAQPTLSKSDKRHYHLFVLVHGF